MRDAAVRSRMRRRSKAELAKRPLIDWRVAADAVLRIGNETRSGSCAGPQCLIQIP